MLNRAAGLESRVRILQQESSQLKVELAQREQECERLSSAVSAGSERCGALAAELQAAREREAQLQERAERQAEELGTKEAELARVRVEAKSASAEIEKGRSAAVQLQGEISALLNETKEIQEAYAKVTASTAELQSRFAAEENKVMQLGHRLTQRTEENENMSLKLEKYDAVCDMFKAAEERKKELEVQVRELQRDIEALENTVAENARNPSDDLVLRSQVQRQLGVINKLTEERDEILAKVAGLEKENAQYVKFKERSKKWQQLAKDKTQKAAAANREISKLRAKLSFRDEPKSNSQVVELETKNKELADQLKACQEELGQLKCKLTRHNKKYLTMKMKMQEMQSQMARRSTRSGGKQPLKELNGAMGKQSRPGKLQA